MSFGFTRTLEKYRPSPVAAGMAWGAFSAVGYTACNVYLRSVSDCDPVFVSCLKAVPTLVFSLPMVLLMARRGERVTPRRPGRMRELFGGAVIAQLAGNVAFQWALGIIGMALCVPICLAALMLSSAWMGRRLLNEPIGWRYLFAMSVLVAAVVVLSGGSSEAYASVAGSTPAPLWYVAAGALAAAVSGVGYAVLGVVIRRCVSDGAPTVTTLCVVSSTGFVLLGITALASLGPAQIASSESRDVARMLMAGVYNAAAFVALTQSLRLIPVKYVNGINAGQTALAGMAGVWLFQEALSWELLGGIFLTGVGLIWMGAPPKETSRSSPADPEPMREKESLPKTRTPTAV